MKNHYESITDNIEKLSSPLRHSKRKIFKSKMRKSKSNSSKDILKFFPCLSFKASTPKRVKKNARKTNDSILITSSIIKCIKLFL